MAAIQDPQLITHRGGCHCGRVRFEVLGPATLPVVDCNCSICAKVGYIHWIVPRNRFQLTRGRDALSEYAFNTATARHYFCKHCGVKSFYIPRSHPGSYSVNVRCLDPGTFVVGDCQAFDGQNWEASIKNMR